MRTSEQINELAGALSKFQGEVENAKKTESNPYFKSRYADLAEVWTTIREPLAKNGLSVIQTASMIIEGNIEINTRLMHSSGQWIEDTLALPVRAGKDKDDDEYSTRPVSTQPPKYTVQSYGSTLTYGRRYCLAAFLGIAQEDDDGNEASGKTGIKKPEAKPEAKKEAPKPEAVNTEAETWAKAWNKRVHALAHISKWDGDARLAMKLKEGVEKAKTDPAFMDIVEKKVQLYGLYITANELPEILKQIVDAGDDIEKLNVIGVKTEPEKELDIF